MLDYLRSEIQFIGLVLMWFVVSYFLGPIGYAFLPLTLMALKTRDRYADMIFGFVIVLVLSDIHKDVWQDNIFRNAKNIYIVLLAIFLLVERERFQPFSHIFTIFLPFFMYSVFPLMFSSAVFTGVQKTLSYALLFLVVPNYVLFNFREQGWHFFRNMIFFFTVILVAGLILRYIDPTKTFVMGRFHGIFGNPNGMAIFCYLFFVLVGVVTAMKPDLFTWRERAVIFGIIVYCIIISGSRASLAAAMIYLLFNRFFAYSPFLGFVVLLAVVGVSEVVSQNLSTIVMALGLEDYFRLRTLEGGSGRYFAWEFAWGKIQDFLVFGGGFANDETIMRQNYDYLERMGHQGGVHNSYLSMWFNVGFVGLFIYFRSFFLLFFKASKLAPMSLAAMFSVLFSINYESWLVGSLNPYTIMLLIVMTILSEEEIAGWRGAEPAVAEGEGTEPAEDAPPAVLPGRIGMA
jgi:hypothetical protein